MLTSPFPHGLATIAWEDPEGSGSDKGNLQHQPARLYDQDPFTPYLVGLPAMSIRLNEVQAARLVGSTGLEPVIFWV